MMVAIPICVVVGIAAGPVLANISKVGTRHALGWLLLVSLILVAHVAMCDCSSFVRMVGLCSVLLGCMKGLVYADWAGREKLPLMRYMIFSFLWFGMDPGTFLHRRAGLSWKPDVMLGAFLALAGMVGTWLVWVMDWQHIVLMFIPLSLGFHFGVLRILKGGLRFAGFPVRTLFPNPLCATGVADFWSRRWNVGYSQMMQRLVGRPVEKLLGKKAGVMAVFIGSGVLHEIAITLPVGCGFGLPTIYFTMHGLLTMVEGMCKKSMGKIFALVAVVLPLPWLFPPTFQQEVIAPCIRVFEGFR